MTPLSIYPKTFGKKLCKLFSTASGRFRSPHVSRCSFLIHFWRTEKIPWGGAYQQQLSAYAHRAAAGWCIRITKIKSTTLRSGSSGGGTQRKIRQSQRKKKLWPASLCRKNRNCLPIPWRAFPQCDIIADIWLFLENRIEMGYSLLTSMEHFSLHVPKKVFF